MILDIPIWKRPVNINDRNQMLTFVENFSGGIKKIIWKSERVDLDIDDPIWMLEACEAVTKLSRYELCLLYVYTTQAYGEINNFLRNRSNKNYDTELVNTSDTWWHAFRGTLTVFSKPSYLNNDVDKKKVVAYKNAQRTVTETPSKKNWAAADKLHDQLFPFFTNTFKKLQKKEWIDHSLGIIYYPQAARIYNLKSIAEFKQIIDNLTNDDWIRILNLFVTDLDKVFDKMPPTKQIMTTYRGVKNLKTLKVDEAYSSTTLSADIAPNFANKCCVHEIRVPRGTRIIPLFQVAWNKLELEILLPRCNDFPRRRI